jgi:hypothetical protein
MRFLFCLENEEMQEEEVGKRMRRRVNMLQPLESSRSQAREKTYI